MKWRCCLFLCGCALWRFVPLWSFSSLFVPTVPNSISSESSQERSACLLGILITGLKPAKLCCERAFPSHSEGPATAKTRTGRPRVLRPVGEKPQQRQALPPSRESRAPPDLSMEIQDLGPVVVAYSPTSTSMSRGAGACGTSHIQSPTSADRGCSTRGRMPSIT